MLFPYTCPIFVLSILNLINQHSLQTILKEGQLKFLAKNQLQRLSITIWGSQLGTVYAFVNGPKDGNGCNLVD
jgi:hypothetical protein